MIFVISCSNPYACWKSLNSWEKLNSQSHTKIETSLNHYKILNKVQKFKKIKNKNIVAPCQLQHIHVCKLIYLILEFSISPN